MSVPMLRRKIWMKRKDLKECQKTNDKVCDGWLQEVSKDRARAVDDTNREAKLREM